MNSFSQTVAYSAILIENSSNINFHLVSILNYKTKQEAEWESVVYVAILLETIIIHTDITTDNIHTDLTSCNIKETQQKSILCMLLVQMKFF